MAVARALANDPKLLIADEPTGQLDSETGRSIMDLLRAIVHARGMTALVATHDAALMDLADRVLSPARRRPWSLTRKTTECAAPLRAQPGELTGKRRPSGEASFFG